MTGDFADTLLKRRRRLRAIGTVSSAYWYLLNSRLKCASEFRPEELAKAVAILFEAQKLIKREVWR